MPSIHDADTSLQPPGLTQTSLLRKAPGNSPGWASSPPTTLSPAGAIAASVGLVPQHPTHLPPTGPSHNTLDNKCAEATEREHRVSRKNVPPANPSQRFLSQSYGVSVVPAAQKCPSSGAGSAPAWCVLVCTPRQLRRRLPRPLAHLGQPQDSAVLHSVPQPGEEAQASFSVRHQARGAALHPALFWEGRIVGGSLQKPKGNM